jgi:uncharacterized protein (DUF1800 family)
MSAFSPWNAARAHARSAGECQARPELPRRPRRKSSGPHGSWRTFGATLAACAALAACGGGGSQDGPPGATAQAPAGDAGDPGAGNGPFSRRRGGRDTSRREAAQGFSDTQGANGFSRTRGADGSSHTPGGGLSRAQGDHGLSHLQPGGSTTRADAFRLLTQATFGPTEADVEHVMAVGAEAWIDEQLALPVRAHHLQRWDSDNQDDPGGASSGSVDSSFYQEAIRSDDQLRQRVTYALSQIFVVSMLDLGLAGPKSQAAASWLDMLAHNAFGNYRQLLEAVALHPAMGVYLSSMANRMEKPGIGRIPDQNFAREVMQLFSIGLVQLNIDGTAQLDGNGRPVYTYGPGDIDGLSRVVTGFSWDGPDTCSQRFFNAEGWRAIYRMHRDMQPYSQYHSLSEKDFLGVAIPPENSPDPQGDLKKALDALASHPNVAPFLSRQLIQRLVESDPSPSYVARVARVWNDDGTGVRGNLSAVVKAILLDREARSAQTAAGDTYGKVREPVLRFTAFLRAYDAHSDSGKYLVFSTDDPGMQLAQSPLRARSVFNFYRPGYVPDGGPAQRLHLVLPEMQITDETSVAGYVNFMMGAVRNGVGVRGFDGNAPRPDVQPDYTDALKLADDPATLVADTTGRLLGPDVDAALTARLVGVVTSINVPQANGRNQAFIDKQLHNRVYAATLLTLASPEFVTQK